MKSIPLTVLVHDAPCARAYLTAMRQAGLRPRKIILMVDSRKPGSQKPLLRWIPENMRTQVAERIHEQANNYWPRRIIQKHPGLVGKMAEKLQPWFPNASQMFQEITQQFRYENYADEVQRVLVAGLKDKRLHASLLKEPAGTPILFTGGGILPASLVEMTNVRFMHVHPGVLPFVRGADGLLWSVLVRQKLGASCFYMERGIDTGTIIAAQEYSQPTISIPSANRPDDATLYRAVFSFFDPFMRANLLLREVLSSGDDLFHLPAHSQQESEGITFHFLRPELRHKALIRVFPNAA
jgi:hypothetical protein